MRRLNRCPVAKMSRSHFVVLADMLGQLHAQASTESARRLARAATTDIMSVCKQSNARFDEGRFLDAIETAVQTYQQQQQEAA